MKTLLLCTVSTLVSLVSIADISVLEEKDIGRGIGRLRSFLVEVGGHEYVVFSHADAIHSQHHAGCKACTPKPPVVMYLADPSVETDVRTEVTCAISFGSNVTTGDSGVSSFSVRTCTLDELKRIYEGWEALFDRDRPLYITFYITKTCGYLMSVNEKRISVNDFLNKVVPNEKRLSIEQWKNAVIKNLEKFPSSVHG